MTQAMTIEDQAGAGLRSVLVSLSVQGGKHRPRHQAKATVSVQQDQDQQSGRMEVIVEPKTLSLSGPLAVEDQL